MSRSKLSNQDLKFYNTGGGSDVIYAKIKGSVADTLVFEGASGATKVKLTNVADPTATGHAATYDWVNTKLDSLSNGLNWKAPVKARTTANLAGSLVGNVLTMTANGQQNLDGIAIAAADRVLIADQTDQKQNGIYTCTTQGDVRGGFEAQAVFSRSGDADSSSDLKSCAVFAEQGTSNSDSAFVQTTDGLVLGTSNVAFAQFSSAGEILAGTGLSKSGNTISASVDDATIEISAGSLSVKGNSITANQIATNTITGNEIVDGSISNNELGVGCVTESKIIDGEVKTAKVANLAIASGKLADGAVIEDKIATDAVVADKIKSNAVTETKLIDGAVTTSKITNRHVTTGKLAVGAVTSTELGPSAVTTAKIAPSAVEADQLNTNAVITSKIFARNVTDDKLADGSVITRCVATDQINASHLKANAVTEAKIADGSVSASKLAANSVTTSKIGTLTGLVVNGLVNATGFVATGSGSESDGGFSLPKAKSLSIDFNTTQVIVGNDTFATVGGDSSLAAVAFAADDNITMALTSAAFRITHSGTNGSSITPNFEISYYNGAGVAQAYEDVSGAPRDFQLYSSTALDYQLSTYAVLGDGSTKIAGVRLRLKHDQAGDSVAVKDSMQITCIAIDDSSGNVNRTYNNGSIS